MGARNHFLDVATHSPTMVFVGSINGRNIPGCGGEFVEGSPALYIDLWFNASLRKQQ